MIEEEIEKLPRSSEERLVGLVSVQQMSNMRLN